MAVIVRWWIWITFSSSKRTNSMKRRASRCGGNDMNGVNWDSAGRGKGAARTERYDPEYKVSRRRGTIDRPSCVPRCPPAANALGESPICLPWSSFYGSWC